ncbi:hypothetical protein EV363DRAFT_1338245 [Boletus edulis]|uniref:Uncharacterized protein n=1 Tax=Boletus edulis BED1 TaxID=1328754 RepID=A0AAD4BQF0_BOLED|nr:hypothetical protein EV363DRAFT_1338245 [Boletus edulis]KAF8437556.1 hypothetical protein L210DRAFT_3546073 [Boletus edulis BED1]
MPSRLQPYALPSAMQSSLMSSHDQPEAVPSLDELESLHAELESLRQKTLERAHKAGEVLDMIEASMRRAKKAVKRNVEASGVDRVEGERGLPVLVDPGPALVSDGGPDAWL